MSRPMVIMTMAKSGSPIMGRMVIRSITNPKAPVARTAVSAESAHCRVTGPPMNRPGKFRVTAKYAVK